jgi:hypothetical protein
VQTPDERSREATVDVPIAERVARVSVTDDEDDDMEGDEVEIGEDYGDFDDEGASAILCGCTWSRRVRIPLWLTLDCRRLRSPTPV